MDEARKPAGKVDILPAEGTPRRYRSDGWDPRKQQYFIEVLTRTGCIRDAARAVALSKTAVTNLRNRDPAFDRACEAALTTIRPSLIETAYQRAVMGVEEPVFQGGKLVGTKRKYSDSMLRLLIDRGFDPAKLETASPPDVVTTRPTQEEVDKALKGRLDALAKRLKKEERENPLAFAERMAREGWAP